MIELFIGMFGLGAYEVYNQIRDKDWVSDDGKFQSAVNLAVMCFQLCILLVFLSGGIYFLFWLASESSGSSDDDYFGRGGRR